MREILVRVPSRAADELAAEDHGEAKPKHTKRVTA
jgi:hypothetical protein